MKYTQLTENERYQIYLLKKEGYTNSAIAHRLGRSPATIGRELRRNTGLRGYRPQQAQNLAESRRINAYKHRKLTPKVIGWLEDLIRQELSPQQACNYLKRHKGIRLHHETVYLHIYDDQAYGGDLYTHLRIVSKPYRKRYGSYDRRGKIKNRVSIDERPAVVDRRNRIGDWEGDTIIGKGRQSALITLVERKSLYTVILKTQGKHAECLANNVIRGLKPLKDRVKTITYDNGLEFSLHEMMSEQLEADIFFAHPYASWERGLNENTNGLIRQYFPKGTDFNKVSDADIAWVMNRLNNRPRESLGHRSPNEIFNHHWEDLLAA